MSAVRIPDPVQRVARATARTVGRWTADHRMLPSFLIGGAQRCGTTSMYKTVTAHPQVLPAVLHKGVHYFDTNYGKDLDWYRGHFPTTRTARRAATGDAPVITGESSPYYLFHPMAATRIAADLPGVKMIILLRDPVERAYSAYTHEFARGYEDQPFERALALEPARLAGEEERLVREPTYVSLHHQHHAYVTRGRYAYQLERLERALGRERIFVVDSGDLFTDPAPVFSGLWSFLGLTQWQPGSFAQHNARPRSDLDDTVREQLTRGYEEDDERLAAWLGRIPSWRR